MKTQSKYNTIYAYLRAAVLALFLAPTMACAQAPNVTYQAPLVITKGGTYSGNYRSLDSSVPCIKVSTTDPVIIEGCILAGAGELITVDNFASVTVRNNKGYSLPQSRDNIVHGRFLGMIDGKSLTLEHNYFEHTTGILVYRWTGNGSAAQTIKVRYNQAREIDGRYRNGGSLQFPNFLQFNQVRNTANIDISFNEVINTPNQCATGDVINFYNSSGTSQSPMALHDNYVQGAYPYPANIRGYSGTGMTTDGDGTTAATITAFLNAYDNQFVSTCNAAMNIAAGHDIHYYRNRMVTSAYLPDGSAMLSAWAATAVFNGNGSPNTVFFNNTIENNVIGYRSPGVNNPYPDRQDESSGSCATCLNNTHLPNPITLQTEANELTLWKQKVQQQNITLGPITTSAAAANAAPTVSLNVPAPGTVGTALALNATAADADGTVSQVEFFNGTISLGKATQAPFSISYTPTAAGTLSLTARATDNAGATTTSAAVALSVAAPASVAATFYRALNLGGGALTIDGNNWEAASGAPGFVTNVTGWSSPTATLSPATDAARATMLRSALFGVAPNLALSGVPSGTYTVYLYIWEDNNPVTINISLEGKVVRTGYSSGSAGHWERVGPFTSAITDGTINVATTGGNVNLSGLEIWRQQPGTSAKTSASAQASLTSVAPASTLALSVFPNPGSATSQLQVPVTQPETVEVSIHNAQGVAVSQLSAAVSPSAPTVPLPTSSLPPGSYLVRILSGSQRGKSIQFMKS